MLHLLQVTTKIPAAKAAAPIDEVQDYVDPNLNPAHAELDRLIVTRMKNDPKLSYQQSFTREYLAPANRSLKERVDQESILCARRFRNTGEGEIWFAEAKGMRAFF